VSRERPRHLQPGWCWEASLDGEPRLWGIYGHFDDAQAVEIASTYEGEEVLGTVERAWARSVPCRRSSCECDGGSHLEPASGPGRGASPLTWVTETEPT
jgi:hypothetical protein